MLMLLRYMNIMRWGGGGNVKLLNVKTACISNKLTAQASDNSNIFSTFMGVRGGAVG
jgi:hypothetical protein